VVLFPPPGNKKGMGAAYLFYWQQHTFFTARRKPQGRRESQKQRPHRQVGKRKEKQKGKRKEKQNTKWIGVSSQEAMTIVPF
jgi:alkylated DNA repair dioxygenase AlkB